MKTVPVAIAVLLLEAGAASAGAQSLSRTADVIVTWDSTIRITTDTLSDGMPEIVTAGDTIHLFWIGGEGLYGGAEYAQSTDEGSTFGAPRTIAACTLSGGWVSPELFSFGAAGGTPFATATSIDVDTNLVPHYSIAFTMSLDGGTTWDPFSPLAGCDSCYTETRSTTAEGDQIFWFVRYVTLSDPSLRLICSTNGGADWRPPVVIPSGDLPARICANAFGLHYAGIRFNDSTSELYYQHTTDLGLTWANGAVLSSPNDDFQDAAGLAASEAGRVYAVWRSIPTGQIPPGTGELVCFRRSTDNGATWESAQTLRTAGGIEYPAVTASGPLVAVAWTDYDSASAAGRAVMRVSPDEGVSWSDVIDLGGGGDISVGFTGAYLHYAWSELSGTPEGEIYHRRGTVQIVNAAGDPYGPGVFSLERNYPNPFNGTTTIAYSLGRREGVSLTVYTILGELAGTLVNGIESAGNHEAHWSPGDRPGGVYFYRLRAGQRTETGKMLFLK